MFVIKYRKLFYAFSAILIAASIAAVSIWGLNIGIDFKGGSILEVAYKGTVPTFEEVEHTVKNIGLQGASARATGTNGYIIRTESLTDSDRTALLKALSFSSTTEPVKEYEVKRLDSIGPILGQELKVKAWFSIILVLLAIVLFITYVFRKVSEPVSSFKYGLVAIVALLHDIIIPTGVFAVLGHFYGFEVDALFITALLVILGFSVHDTIVVFDRTREHLRAGELKKKSFEQIVGESVSQTFTRSINTSLTVVLTLFILYIFGADATKSFSLVMLIGIIVGTYSSIFVGSPLLVTLEKIQHNKAK